MDYKYKELVDKAKAGDNNATGELIAKLTPLIISYANKYGNMDMDREELIQEGYLEILYRIYDFDETKGVPFLGYLKVMLKYFYMNYFRGEKTVAVSLDKKIETSDGNINVIDTISDKNADVFEEYLKNERTKKLYKAINNLTHKQRKVIILYYIKGLSIKEIAKNMNVHYMSVVKLKQRAVKKMRGMLSFS